MTAAFFVLAIFESLFKITTFEERFTLMKIKHTLIALAAPLLMNAQQKMTPEILWTLKKIGVQAVSPDQSMLFYKVGQVDLKTEKTNNKNYSLNIVNGQTQAMDFGKKSVLNFLVIK